MTNDQREQVSACLDNELASDAIQETIDALSKDGECRDIWARYNLIGDVIRGEHIFDSSGDLAERIRNQLESEPAIIALPKEQGQDEPVQQTAKIYWLKPAAGLAAAASVAAIALFGISDFQNQVAPEGDLQVASTPPTVIYQTATGTRWKNLSQPGVESKLNRYLVDHSEYASPGGMSGVLPYASFVSYDSER